MTKYYVKNHQYFCLYKSFKFTHTHNFKIKIAKFFLNKNRNFNLNHEKKIQNHFLENSKFSLANYFLVSIYFFFV